MALNISKQLNQRCGYVLNDRNGIKSGVKKSAYIVHENRMGENQKI
jgi:hypothetical protein